MSLLDAGDYETAYALLEEIGNNYATASSKYNRAVELIDSEDYKNAYLLLDGINYKNSKELQESIELQYKKVLLFYKFALQQPAIFRFRSKYIHTGSP